MSTSVEQARSGPTRTCGERISSAVARELWTQIREEAVAAVEHDRVMATAYATPSCRHDTFADALAHRLARKLCRLRA